MNSEPQEQGSAEPNRIWEQPTIQELLVQQTAHNPGAGFDGDFFPDCSAS